MQGKFVRGEAEQCWSGREGAEREVLEVNKTELLVPPFFLVRRYTALSYRWVTRGFSPALTLPSQTQAHTIPVLCPP